MQWSDVQAIAAALERAGIPAARADYWLANHIQFASRDTVSVVAFSSPRFGGEDTIPPGIPNVAVLPRSNESAAAALSSDNLGTGCAHEVREWIIVVAPNESSSSAVCRSLKSLD